MLAFSALENVNLNKCIFEIVKNMGRKDTNYMHLQKCMYNYFRDI